MLSLNTYVVNILHGPATWLGADNEVVSKNIHDFCSHGVYNLRNTDNQIIIYNCNSSGVRRGGTGHCESLW